jgi:hypothetical protein
MLPPSTLTILCPGLSLCAITLILFFVFLYQLRGPFSYIFFVPGQFAGQGILVLKCGQQNDLTPVDKVDDEST